MNKIEELYAAGHSVDPDPATVALRVSELPEFGLLREYEPTCEWLFVRREIVRGGATVLGEVHLPCVQGKLRGVFDWLLATHFGRTLDFLILLSLEFWQRANARQREILVYHELSHIWQRLDREGEPMFNEEGLPVWGIKAHDVEDFTAVVRRYGAYSADLRDFVAATREGETAHAE